MYSCRYHRLKSDRAVMQVTSRDPVFESQRQAMQKQIDKYHKVVWDNSKGN